MLKLVRSFPSDLKGAQDRILINEDVKILEERRQSGAVNVVALLRFHLCLVDLVSLRRWRREHFVLMLGQCWGAHTHISECLIESQRVTNHPITFAFIAALMRSFSLRQTDTFSYQRILNWIFQRWNEIKCEEQSLWCCSLMNVMPVSGLTWLCWCFYVGLLGGLVGGAFSSVEARLKSTSLQYE